jgi:hypothetical protein
MVLLVLVRVAARRCSSFDALSRERGVYHEDAEALQQFGQVT